MVKMLWKVETVLMQISIHGNKAFSMISALISILLSSFFLLLILKHTQQLLRYSGKISDKVESVQREYNAKALKEIKK